MVVVYCRAFGASYHRLYLVFLCKGRRDPPCPRPGSHSSPPGSSRLPPPPLGVEWCVFSPIVCDGVRGLVGDALRHTALYSFTISIVFVFAGSNSLLALRLHRIAVVRSEFILIRVR